MQWSLAASFALSLVLLFTWTLQAAEPTAPPAGPLQAWYRDDGVQIEGAEAVGWENATEDAAGRRLSRVVGRPQVIKVETPSGARSTVRFDGRAALWQAVGAWGTLSGERTVVALVRLPAGGRGVLFDGSTRAGSAPAAWNAGAWKSAARTFDVELSGGWRALTFVFPADSPPLGGLILGANVATGEGLACDVAELLVYPRALDEAERAAATGYLKAKWGPLKELPAAQQPQPARPPEDPRLLRVVVRKRGDDGVDTYRIPGLATTTQGTLIAVFDVRNKHGADLPGDIDVGMMRSTDDGATWSPLRRIIDFDAAEPGSKGNGVGDPAVLVDRRTGAIFVVALWSKGARAWHGSGPGLTPDETGQLVLVKSVDDGLTWSAPASITSQVKRPEWRLCFNGPGAGIQLRDGTLVFPAQFKETREAPGAKTSVAARSCFIASQDGGRTWKISPAAIPDGPQTSESSVVELSDGSLLLSMRDESRSGRRAWAKWERRADLWDGKWSESWLDLPDPTCMASLVRHPSGELVFSNPNHASRRVALTVRTSGDDGRTWTAGRLLDPRGAMYSSLTVLRDGRLGVLYESVADAGLVFVRFPLEWLKESQDGATRP